MAEITLEPEIIEIPEPDISNLITEDDTPVDNIFSEKQQRLLTETLYTTWRKTRGTDAPFVALANVGLFYGVDEPAEREYQRAERLAAQLRALGVEPED